MVESAPPSGPEASESTADENEDDTQFVGVSSNDIRFFPESEAVRGKPLYDPTHLFIIQQTCVHAW